MNDEPVKTIEYKDEKQMIEEFVDDLYKSYDRYLATAGWVGHNIRNFDLPWIIHRIWKYGATKVLHMLPTGQRDKRIIDTSELWGVSSFKNYTSLDSICNFLGLKTKEGIDGGQVYDHFLRGEHEKVYQYCRDDVDERLRPLHNIMRGT
jgi:DNA polymerase elongation subunit (family B)